ncbi:BQ2448_488 [Microbotryum intermedium]|uniref:BQ2448_488 protein n=1 Tax=Microbotryum intermedium TaxID=269621 RepID=A0A238F5N4_9BASI|nr:BQ2448_488 [Microbotryum intermedium]
MSSPEHAAKRIKVDTPSSSTIAEATTTATATANEAPAPSSSTSTPFSFANEKGLFKLIEPSLGIRPALEPEVGITEYVNRDVPPFAAIIKHRFTDFMVFEVGLDGQVLRMKDILGPKQEKAPRPPKPKYETFKAEPTPEDTRQLWTDKAESILKPLLDEAKLAEFKTFVLAGPSATPGTPKPVFQSQIIESKEARTALHKGLREAFDSRFGSEMKELEGGEQVIQVAWMRGAGGGGGGRGGDGARGDRRDRNAQTTEGDLKAKLPPYIHFTLQKANKEMHDALSGLCRTLNLQSRDIGAAGTKDKRAVTVQRLSMKRGHRTIEDVWNAANGSGRGRGGNRGRGRGRGGGGFGGSQAWGNMDRGVRIADVAYGEKMFTLGMLKGNRFVITLREVIADSPTTIERAMSTLREHGFINYYGMQRFGTAPVPTHAIGLALLRTDWALASHLMLLHRQGEGDDVALARSLFHEGKLADASRAMPRRAVAEKAMVDFYAKNGTTSHLGALSSIPKSLRMMYAHAWQSYIWNRVVSERVKMYGCKEPVVGDFVLAEGARLKEDGEDADEPEVVAPEPLDPVLDEDVEPTPTHPGLTAEQAAATARIPKIKILTQEDIAAKAYTIFDVVLPMPGYAVMYPSGPLGETYRSIMLEDGIDPQDMFRRQREYSLGGTYRKLMHLPKDVSHKLMTYTSSTQDLAQSDEDLLLGKEAPVVTSYDPSQPLPEGHSLALQLEMTLGSSTYATMALREVLKTRTASAHQKTLTEAMEQREHKVLESTAAAAAARVAQAEEPVLEEAAAVQAVVEDVTMAP